jgi:fumarate reductase iron-sulfur subunit
MRLKRTNGSDEMNETIKVSIWRGHGKGRYVSYEVPRLGSQTVLDIVTYVQRYIDPTLSYRFACRVGVCGSCAMTVNGRPRWTCRTHVEKVTDSGQLELGPLANLPVIKDLATDMTHFFEKWQQAKGTFVPSKTRNDAIEEIDPDTPARIAIDKAIECINCGVCFAACDSVRWNSDYLGPAALNRAWTLVNDERDAGNPERLAAIAAKGGCHSCHTHQSCERHCPQAINPTASIAGLKRRTIDTYMRGELK